MKEKILKKENIPVLVLCICAFIIMIPMFNFRIGLSHDGYIHIERALFTENTIKSQNKYPYILEKMYNGAGSAANVFYPPITTFVPILIKLITNSYQSSYAIFTGIIFFIYGISMYLLSKEITKNNLISLMSGIICMTLPYTIQNIYIRFAIGEFAALAFVPLLFLGLYNLLKGDGKKKYWILISAIIIILTHLITTIYTAILSFIFIIYNYKKLDKNKIKTLCLYVLIILGITSFYWGPLIE